MGVGAEKSPAPRLEKLPGFLRLAPLSASGIHDDAKHVENRVETRKLRGAGIDPEEFFFSRPFPDRRQAHFYPLTPGQTQR